MQGQRQTIARWPWQRAYDGEVAGREEERCVQRVPGGIRRPKLVGWVCKEETELGLPWLRWWRHYSDGAGSPELSGGDGKSRGIERRRTATVPGLYRAAKAQGGDTQWPARASAKPRATTGATGSQEKDADSVA